MVCLLFDDPRHSSVKSRCILIVEESQRNLERIREIFQGWDTPVSLNMAFSIEEAKRFLTNTSPNLLITALRVRDGNYFDLLGGGDCRYPVIVLVPQGEEAELGAIEKLASEHAIVTASSFAELPRVIKGTLREWQHIEEKLRLQKTVDTVPDFVGMADRHGRMLYINSSGRKMLGLGDTETIATRRLHDLFPGWSIDSMIGDHIPGAMPDPPASTKMTRYEGHDIHGTVFAHLLESGEIEYFSIYAAFADPRTREDISNSQDDQLKRRLETIGKLAAGLAHDLNNALTPIIGQTELAMQHVKDDDVSQNALSEVLRAANRAKELARQIVSFGSPTGAERKPIRIETVVGEALKVVRAALPSSIRIDQHLPKTCGTVMADRPQIYQLVVSLCLRSFERGGGELGIQLEHVKVDEESVKLQPGLRVDDYARLTITNAGGDKKRNTTTSPLQPHTIQDNSQDRILAEAHRIAVAHGGDMTTHKHPGSGMTVRVYLPVTDVKGKESEIAEPGAHGTKSILVVDDEDMITDTIAPLLRSLGYLVTTKNDPLDALQTFCSDPDRYDLVITDQTMPQMGGEQLVTQIRRVRRDIPVILTTGYNCDVTAAVMQSLGIRGFLHKPFGIRELASTVQQALSRP